MRPQSKILWESDDVSLQQEFVDVSRAWKVGKTDAKSVPAALDRAIRRQAGVGSEHDLMNSWIFGAIPKLSLAAAILFGVGIMFLSSLQLPGSIDRGNGDAAAINSIAVDPVVASLMHSDGRNSGHYEIEFQFVLDAGRKAVNATIASRCQVGDSGNCVSLEDQNAARVDQIARMLLNRRTFEAGINSAKIEVSQNQLLQE
ncbi:MAG: hypothetical protein ACJAVI_000239 [Candidatus Azotimanducaceae bacterium]|jgi:hypothetical protein